MSDYRLVRFRGKFAVVWYEGETRHRVTLGTDSRAEADRLLARFVEDRKAATRPAVATVADVWDGYRASLGERPAAVTMGFEWKAVGPRFATRSAAEITEDDCTAYTAARRAQGRSDGTISTELRRLRAALRWAEGKRLIDRAPKVFVPPAPPPRDKRLTREQVRSFLDACKLPHVRLFATLALTTGARAGAILGLEWSRVNFESGMIDFVDPGRATTKKGRVVAPMNGLAREALTEAHRGALSPYVIEWAGRPVASVKKGLASAGARCGLAWGMSPHVCRHTAASLMAEAGVGMPEIAAMLGHKDSRTSERIYARFSPTYLRRAAAALEFV